MPRTTLSTMAPKPRVASSVNGRTGPGWLSVPPYAPPPATSSPRGGEVRTPRYRGSCHCGAVRFEAYADPMDSKVCHCRECQVLHGAPMQWVAVFQKSDVLITKGLDDLVFYDSARRWAPPCRGEHRTLPSKVTCGVCRAPIADEGRRMWLAFPTLFHFDGQGETPEAFRPSCHVFYGNAAIEVNDDLPKFEGLKDHSRRLDQRRMNGR